MTRHYVYRVGVPCWDQWRSSFPTCQFDSCLKWTKSIKGVNVFEDTRVSYNSWLCYSGNKRVFLPYFGFRLDSSEGRTPRHFKNSRTRFRFSTSPNFCMSKYLMKSNIKRFNSISVVFSFIFIFFAKNDRSQTFNIFIHNRNVNDILIFHLPT